MGLTVQPIIGVFKKTPYSAGLKPAGRDVAKDIPQGDGIPLLMTPPPGLLHGECMIVTGRTVAENLKSVKSSANQDVVRPANDPITLSGDVAGLAGIRTWTARSVDPRSVLRMSGRIARLAAVLATAAVLGLAPGLTPAFAFEGTVRPPADVAPPPAASRVQGDVPRPPGSIPRAGASAPAAAVPNAALPRPRGAMPVVSTPNAAVDNTMAPPTAFAAPSAPIAPFEALKSGTRALKDGEKQKALVSLEYAADQGIVAAKWKLGRMYAAGEGVEQSAIRAFEYFREIADDHADDNPNGPDARYVANAFVSLGHYYRSGIPDSDVRPDLGRARRVYDYAASYFRDADAQYHLARLMLENGPYRDPRQAARWLHSAANKGQTHAQAVLGRMLFKGENGPRQPACGLMWLTVASSNAAAGDAWIVQLHDLASKQATVEERAYAGDLLVRWMNGSRERFSCL